MREILFRGMTLSGEMFIGSSLIQEGETVWIRDENTTLEVKPEAVSQYTGLKDKNGKKIFEWDLFIFCNGSVNGVEWINLDDNRKPIKYIVKFENGRFNLPKWFMEGETDSTHWVEIIGNIWEDGE